MNQKPNAYSVRKALPSSIGFTIYRHSTFALFAIDTFRADQPSRYPFLAATPATDLPLEMPPEGSMRHARARELQFAL
jgi:hypothetical protein